MYAPVPSRTFGRPPFAPLLHATPRHVTSAFPFVFGVGVYCFEGMGMVIPIEDAMTNRENFTPILSVVMVIYTTLCVLSGGLGYMAFGDETEVRGVIFNGGGCG